MLKIFRVVKLVSCRLQLECSQKVVATTIKFVVRFAVAMRLVGATALYGASHAESV